MTKIRKVLPFLALVLVLALLGAVLVSTVSATDPSPQSVDGVRLYDVAVGDREYTDDTVLKVFPNQYGVVDVYFTAALSETGVTTMTIQHSPDGTNAWVDYATSVYTFTSSTAPDFVHVRLPVYGQALGFEFDLDGENTTPEIYIVAKDNAGQ